MITHRVMDTTDVDRLINLDLREMDRLEVEASTGLPVHDGLRHSIELSVMVYVIEKEGIAEGLWGWAVTDTMAVPWFLCTDKLLANKRDRINFARESRLVIEGLSAAYDMFNFVCTENTESIEWLKWLGFTVHEDRIIELGNDLPFFMFTKGKNPCVIPSLQ
jgi:hypothetical protein